VNVALQRLAADIGLAEAEHERLRLAFGQACAERVRLLLEDPQVVECLDLLREHLLGHAGGDALEAASERARALASRHPGSKSIDGAGHAAVSASHAVARALAGRAIDAADYAAYAAVYAAGGSAAVADPAAFEAEFDWQVRTLRDLGAALPPLAGRAFRNDREPE
jgi:hypothetical protein